MTILPNLMGESPLIAEANGINNRGDVVGISCVEEFQDLRGFLFRRGEIIDIGTPAQ
jgi:probable HAF family extracellular repeat protein